MKNLSCLILLPVLFVFSLNSFCQLSKQLCGQKEEIVFAFHVNNQKWVSVCKEKNEKYLVYRFGTQNNIELQYPYVLDSTSWQKFTFKGYNRGGGKQNAAMYYAYLHFANNNIRYEVYETWNSEDDQRNCGISIDAGKKNIDIKGVLKTEKGTLLSLLYNGRIKKEEEE